MYLTVIIIFSFFNLYPPASHAEITSNNFYLIRFRDMKFQRQ
ncbi:hypothetical protein N507_2041 [Lacticaseibacillus rhamnosus DSM 14870]|nr:hypothetical protein N507_2041 [Lacticaseibacillus rhamnosus DSM 14870]